MRRAAAIAVVAVVALVLPVGASASAFIDRGSAGTPLTIAFKGANDSTTATVTIAADGTYKADFGIAQVGDYTATIKRPNGRTLAAIPITVTQATEPCITPTAGTGADWGVTHAPFPVDPGFPSYVTVCGRVALAGTGNESTPAGSPPSIGSPSSVSRDDAGDGNVGGGGVFHDNGDGSSDGGGFPWFLTLVVIVGIGVVVGLLWQHGRTRRAASTPPGPSNPPQ